MNGSFWDHEQPSGALSIDESITLGQAVCSGNANSSMFILLPQPHSSCSLVTILKHKRLVEDKMVATLTSMISQTPEIKRFCDVALSTLLQPNQMALCVTCLDSEGLWAGCPGGSLVIQRQRASGRSTKNQPELLLGFQGSQLQGVLSYMIGDCL